MTLSGRASQDSFIILNPSFERETSEAKYRIVDVYRRRSIWKRRRRPTRRLKTDD
jgi:hypothetical protein